MRSGFHKLSDIFWQERLHGEPNKPRKLTEDKKKIAAIRKRREQLEDDARLKRELEEVWG